MRIIFMIVTPIVIGTIYEHIMRCQELFTHHVHRAMLRRYD